MGVCFSTCVTKFDDTDSPVDHYPFSSRGCTCPARARNCKHLKIVKNYIGDRQDKVLSMIDAWQEEYAIAPASSKTLYHSAFPGGYVDHVNRVVEYAVKQMNKQFLKSKSFGKDKSAYDCVLDELQVLKKLEHPNIIWLHEIINDKSKDDIYIVTVYHSKGSLGDQIKLLNEKF